MYPARGKYSDYVTFNDDAMVRVMVLADDMINNRYAFDTDILTSTQRTNLQTALDKGIQYILNSQIVMNGELSVWCAQHDPITYAPKGARAYELPSKSGKESTGIIAFLMSRPQTPAIRNAARNALRWFDTVRVDGMAYDGDGPVFFVSNPSKTLWYRFYNLADNNYFFSDRDGLKYFDIMDISEERRLGYSWQGSMGRTAEAGCNERLLYIEKNDSISWSEAFTLTSPHQGGYVEHDSGESWFMHFKNRKAGPGDDWTRLSTAFGSKQMGEEKVGGHTNERTFRLNENQ